MTLDGVDGVVEKKTVTAPPSEGNDDSGGEEEREMEDDDVEELKKIVSGCSVVVGMHPDQATDAVVGATNPASSRSF